MRMDEWVFVIFIFMPEHLNRSGWNSPQKQFVFSINSKDFLFRWLHPRGLTFDNHMDQTAGKN